MTNDGEQEKINQHPIRPTSPTSPTSERQRSFFSRNSTSNRSHGQDAEEPVEDFDEDKGKPTKWSMGVLNDPDTHEVPGMNNCKDLGIGKAN